MVPLRLEARELLAGYQDLVGVSDPEERKRRIIAAAERQSAAQRPQRRKGRTFVGVPPRNVGFTGRADALDRLDAILTHDKPAARRADERAAVVGIARDGLAKQIQPLERGLLAPAGHQRPRAEIEVVSGQIGGGARGGAADFRFLQRRFDHAGDAERDFVLQLEHVFSTLKGATRAPSLTITRMA